MKPQVACALVAVVVSACMMGQQLTPTEIDSFGTRNHKGSMAAVFQASTEALASLGYPIVVSKPDKGLIITDKAFIRSDGQAVASGNTATATHQTYFRQYEVRLRQVDSETVSVRLTPKIYQGTIDISEGGIWALEGPNGERALWSKLHDRIGTML